MSARARVSRSFSVAKLALRPMKASLAPMAKAAMATPSMSW